MGAYLSVAVGGALGSVGRYWLGVVAIRFWGEHFPWGTLIINILGSFVIGFYGIVSMVGGPMPASPNLRLFVLVGLCGGFTTFSSFSLQTYSLMRVGEYGGAFANVAMSVGLCLLATAAGYMLADRLGT